MQATDRRGQPVSHRHGLIREHTADVPIAVRLDSGQANSEQKSLNYNVLRREINNYHQPLRPRTERYGRSFLRRTERRG